MRAILTRPSSWLTRSHEARRIRAKRKGRILFIDRFYPLNKSEVNTKAYFLGFLSAAFLSSIGFLPSAFFSSDLASSASFSGHLMSAP